MTCKTIGILGGGQLAKMLCDSANKKGLRTIIVDPSEDACGRLSATKHICQSYSFKGGLVELAKESDVITYEFENVPADCIEILEKQRSHIPQGKKPLYISQHRIREKTSVTNLGVKTAEFVKVENVEQLKEGIEKIGLPAILKTCSGGYDGKGQWKIEKVEDIESIELTKKEYILEKMIDFEKEVSCLVVRGLNGDIVTFPVGENIHKNGILNVTIVPARIEKSLDKKIQEISKKIIKGLGFVGPLGIEYFVGRDGEVYFNEMAPRPHNSAHYTMDACNVSQFDLHLESILGEKLEEPKLIKKVVMLNILGEDKEKLEKVVEDENTKIHIYGKTEWKIGRKMGHINFLGDDIEKILEKVKSI